MGTPRWWEMLPASSRSAEYARLDPGRVRSSICRALVTVCPLQPSRPEPSVSSLGPGQSPSQAARRASTSSRTPSITKVGGVCSDPSGRASIHSGNVKVKLWAGSCGGARWALDLLGVSADGQRHEKLGRKKKTQAEQEHIKKKEK